MGILQIKCYAISHAFLRVVSNLTPGPSLLAVQTLTVWRGRGKQPDPGASPSARKERPCVWQKYTSGRPQSASLWVVWGIGRADVGAVAGGHGAGAGCIPSEVSETRARFGKPETAQSPGGGLCLDAHPGRVALRCPRPFARACASSMPGGRPPTLTLLPCRLICCSLILAAPH